MPEIADLLNEGPEVIYSEGLPGDNEDISGFDPMDFGDEPAEPEPQGDVAQEYWTEADADNLKPPVEPAVGGVQRPSQPQPTPKPDNALQAKLRIAEREKKIYQQRLDYILQQLATQNQPPEELEEEENIPDYNEDGLGHIVGKLDKLDRKLERTEAEQKRDQALKYAGSLLSQADTMTNEAIAAVGPDTWNAAMKHLAHVRVEDYKERHPNVTDEEANRFVGDAIIREKIRLVHEGRNPAEVYLKDAVRFGFRAQQPAAAPAQSKQPATHREQIQQQNRRDSSGGRSIASVSGAPPKARLSAQSTLGMDDRHFREVVDDAIRERGGKELSLRDFIAPN